MRREEHFKRMDKMELKSELIYRQQLNYFMNIGKFSATVALGVMTSSCVYKLLVVKDVIVDYSGSFGELIAEAADLYPFLAGFYVLNIAVLVCINLIPMRMYQYDGKYVAILPGLLPTNNLKLYFKKGELVENFNSIISWKGASFKIKGRNVILFGHRFRRPSDLYSMLPESQSTRYLK